MISIQYITSLSTKRLAQVLFQIFSFSNTLGFASGVCSLISEKPDSAYFTGQIPWVGASGGSCLPSVSHAKGLWSCQEMEEERTGAELSHLLPSLYLPTFLIFFKCLYSEFIKDSSGLGLAQTTVGGAVPGREAEEQKAAGLEGHQERHWGSAKVSSSTSEAH